MGNYEGQFVRDGRLAPRGATCPATLAPWSCTLMRDELCDELRDELRDEQRDEQKF